MSMHLPPWLISTLNAFVITMLIHGHFQLFLNQYPVLSLTALILFTPAQNVQWPNRCSVKLYFTIVGVSTWKLPIWSSESSEFEYVPSSFTACFTVAQ